MKTASEIALEAREDAIAEKIVNLQEHVREARVGVEATKERLKRHEEALAEHTKLLAGFIADVDSGKEFPVTDFLPTQQ